MEPLACIRQNKQAVLLDVIVTAGAQRSRIVGIYGSRLKIMLAAPPVEGKANALLLVELSKWLQIPRSAFTLLSGARSRQKTIAIAGCDLLAISQALQKGLGAPT